MTKQYKVLKPFTYEGLVKYTGHIVWMKPSTAAEYIRKHYVKEYVAPKDDLTILSPDEQRDLLRRLQNAHSAQIVEDETGDAGDEVVEVKSGRGKYAKGPSSKRS